MATKKSTDLNTNGEKTEQQSALDMQQDLCVKEKTVGNDLLSSAMAADASSAQKQEAPDKPVSDNAGQGTAQNGKKSDPMQELISRGKAKGSLSNAEIMEALADEDYDLEQIEKLYETLESAGVELTGYLDTPEFNEIENEVEQYESAEDMEKLLAQEGLSIDDPVRMYLNEIG